jgi:hypothetical protein
LLDEAIASRVYARAPMALRFDADGDVVATAADGSFVVARGDRVEVFGGTTSYVVASRGEHVGVSLGVERLAIGTRDGLEMWSAETRAWAVASPRHYGQPLFDGDRLITYHRGCIQVWNVATGELIRVIEDRRITIARASFPLRDDTIALRCSANAANVANAALIVISLARGEVLGLRRPHWEGTFGAYAMSSGHVLTAGRHELRLDEGTHRLENPLKDFELERLSVSPRRLVLGGRGGQVRAWSVPANKLITFETGRSQAIVHVRDDDAEIHAIDSHGAVFAWPAPGDADGVLALFHIVQPNTDALQAAILLAAEGRLDEAVTRLEIPDASPRSRMARVFFESVIERDEPAAFRARCERAGLAPGTKLTVIATDLLKAELTYLALGAYMSWLDAPDPEPTHQQIALGLAIADSLASLDDFEMRTPLLDRMDHVIPAVRATIARIRER